MVSKKLVIKAGKLNNRQYWIDVWKYRELLYCLAGRDFLVRYKQTVVGVLWALIRPIITMIIFTFIFKKVAGLPSEGDLPYPILVLAALLPWQLFSNTVSTVSESIIKNQALVSKIYFPRIIIPISAIASGGIEFIISFCMLIVMMLFYGVMPNFLMLYIFFFLFFTVLVAFGPSLILASMNVKFRDFVHIIPFLMQIAMYLSPVGFSLQLIPEKWRLVYSLNPMVGMIEGFRWIVSGGQNDIYMPAIYCSVVISILFLIIGILFFRKSEKTFADNI